MDRLEFCPNCGASVEPNQIFCIRCGQNLKKNQTPVKLASVEEVIGVVPFVYKTVGMYDFFKLIRELSQNKIKMYTLVATSQRIILAEFSNQVLQEELGRQKSQAKGFVGKLLAGRVLQHKDIINSSQRYLSMAPEQVINETPGNIALDAANINKVNVELEFTSFPSSNGHDDVRSRYLLVIESNQGEYKFCFQANPEDMAVLRSALGDKVHGLGRDTSEKPLFG